MIFHRLILSIAIACIGLNAMSVTLDEAFAAKQKLVGFKLDFNGLNSQEQEALKFIYAYAPLADVTDYEQDFYVKNIRQTLQTREEMPWGKSIPENIFRHFVLPVRVNNEALDNSRIVLYPELKERVKGMSMKEAILEVNHWCHEHVTYQPSDGRTSTPLQSIKTATGRCGEESTLTVATLRAVGIPARQVYTPRWAHTDDNHAWVEAWADGKWYFMGACEPEAVLNLGWFNAPASRALLMHTRAFGDYNGTEEVVLKTGNYTEVNLVDNYAETAKAEFTVVDRQGKPVKGAKVEFKIYNYGELYSAVTKYADANGKTSLTAGKGDMIVWASDSKGQFGWSKVSFGKDTNLKIVISKDTQLPQSIDIVPPVEKAYMPLVSPEMASMNKARLAYEDSVRNAYTSTFITEEKAKAYPEKARKYLVKSKGNHQTIADFFAKYPQQEARAYALLDGLSEKDLRDVTMEVLDDNMTATSSQLSPRVENEPLHPYKHFFARAFEREAQMFKSNPEALVKWVKENLHLNPDSKALRYAQDPVGVYRYRVTDERSRDIFFVAVARSIDIDARKDAVTGKVQYRKDKNLPWVDVKWNVQGEAKVAPQGTLVLRYEANPIVDNPKYYSHFSLSKMENGQLELLNYDENDVSWGNTFKNGAKLDVGTYVLVSGTRQADGSVLATTRKFEIKQGKTTEIDLVMRYDAKGISVIGNFDSESKFNKTDVHACTVNSEPVSILSQTGRGYFVLGIIGVGQEPSNHALRDIAKVSIERPVVLLFEDEVSVRKFQDNDFGLPQNIIYGIDQDGKIASALKAELKLPSAQLPIFIIGDTFNRIVFHSQGYTIGLGEQLQNTLNRLK